MTFAAAAIGNYEALASLTKELREAALRGEWDRLSTIQQRRAAVVDAMAAIDQRVKLADTDSRRKDELIAQILADEAATRDRVNAGMAQMDSELQEGRQELRLLREYRRHVV